MIIGERLINGTRPREEIKNGGKRVKRNDKTQLLDLDRLAEEKKKRHKAGKPAYLSTGAAGEGQRRAADG